VRDLPVLVDNNLNFHEHITQIVSQAFVNANLIHKCFLSKDASTLTRAFNTYISPLQEYASVSWSPHHINDIKLLEQCKGSLPFINFKRFLYKSDLTKFLIVYR
jgi:hypothetical protein